MKTLNEIAEELLEKYGVEKTRNQINSFKMYIRRTIEYNQVLKEIYENAPTKKVTRTNAKIFDDEFVNIIEKLTRGHLLRLNGIIESDFIKQKKNVENKEYLLDFELDYQSKLNLFIEQLFYDKYDFDENADGRDLTRFNKFLNSKTEPTTEDIQILTRLKNPRKYYVHKKK